MAKATRIVNLVIAHYKLLALRDGLTVGLLSLPVYSNQASDKTIERVSKAKKKKMSLSLCLIICVLIRFHIVVDFEIEYARVWQKTEKLTVK